MFALLGTESTFYGLVLDFIHELAPEYTTSLLTDLLNATIQGSTTGLMLVGMLLALCPYPGVAA